MEKKKEFTIEELRKQCDKAKRNFNVLNEQLRKAEQEEEERRKAQLALEKDARKKEVDEAYNKYRKLVNEYVKDYGNYLITSDSDDIITGLLSRPWWRF